MGFLQFGMEAPNMPVANVVAMLVFFFLLSCAPAADIVVCIVEEENYGVSANISEVTSNFKEVDALLRHRLSDLELDIALVRHMVNKAQFPWFSDTACEVINSSCVGVVGLTACHHTQYIKNWAMEHTIPHVIVPHSTCEMTSSSHVKRVTQSKAGQRMLQDLLTHLGWTQVAVLVDSADIAESSFTAGLVKQLSNVYMGTLLFRVFDHVDNDTAVNGSRAHVQNVRDRLTIVKDSFFFNILVVASHNSSALILQEAQTLGLLSRNHFWIIALPYAHCSDLLKEVKANEANILVIHPLPLGAGYTASCQCSKAKTCKEPMSALQVEASVVVESAALLVTSAEQAGYRGHNTESSSVCENNTDAHTRRSEIVKTIEEIQRTQSPLNPDTSYSICSSETGEPCGLVNVGRWTTDSGLKLSVDQVYRNTFRDFGNRKLRVGTQEAKPFVQKIGNSSMFEGLCVDILDELAQALKFTYEFVEPEDKEWGAPKDDLGNWTGIIQQVLQKKVDFGIGPFTITSIREEVIDFTKPFMEDGVGILTKRPNSDAKNMFKMFTPLTPSVWGAVAGAVVLVSACLYSIERLSPFSARNMHGDRDLGVLGCVWLIYGSYMEQGGDPHPRSVSARCLVGFWWLFTILMTSTYTANLAAFLTVTIDESPINSLRELAQSSELKPLVKQGSNVKTLFQEAEGGIYEQVWQKMSDMPTVRSNGQAQQYVLQDSYAYMTDASQLEYIMLKDCTTYSLAKELFNTGGFGFVLQENSPYMDVINYNIMKMQEAGLMDKWRQRWWSSPDPCSSSDRTSAAKKLDWVSLSGLFYIFLGVVSASVVLRLLELWVHGDKVLHFWNRLKSMVRFAAATENGSSPPCQCSVKSTTHCERCNGAPQRSDSRSSQQRKSVFRSRRNRYLSSGYDGPATEKSRGSDEESRVGSRDCRTVCDGSETVDYSVRSPEFQDFDTGNRFWEPTVQRRESARLSARRRNSDQ